MDDVIQEIFSLRARITEIESTASGITQRNHTLRRMLDTYPRTPETETIIIASQRAIDHRERQAIMLTAIAFRLRQRLLEL